VLYPHLMVRKNFRLLLKPLLLVMLMPFYVVSLQVYTYTRTIYINIRNLTVDLPNFGTYIGDLNNTYG